MAKNSITDYSKTAASNTDIQSVDIAEGCLPSGINNAIREIMADLADMNDGTVSLTSPSFAAASLTGNLSFGDNDKAIFGAGSDLQIYHDGSNSFVKDAGTGNLQIQGNHLSLEDSTGTRFLLGLQGGETRIYNQGNEKLAATATGIDVTGNATFDDNGKAIFGAGSDLQIYHDGSDSYIRDIGTGNLKLLADQLQILNAAGTENKAFFVSDGGSYLYHNNSAKLETTSTGIDVTGTVTADGLTVDGDVLIDDGVGRITLDSVSGANRLLSTTTGFGAYEDFEFRADNYIFKTSTTERMRIDSSGNVGIGTSSITGGLFVAKQTDTSFSTTVGTSIGGSSSTGAVEIFGSVTGASLIDFSPNDGVTDFGGRIFYSHGSDYMAVSTSGSERMRINSSGQILLAVQTVGDTGGWSFYPTGSGSSPYLVINKTNTSSTRAIAFQVNSSTAGSIDYTSTATTYATSSDYRLKENVTGITDGIERVKQLNPSRFNFIADADTTVDGFLAHEAQTVVPEAVTGTHNETEAIGDITDADSNTVETGVVEPDTLEDGHTWTETGTQPVYQGIDQSKLVPLLTAALQEAITKIEDLETRVATLEGN